MSLFLKCLEYILKSEGGFVDHPNDSGGPTKYGITWRTLSDYRKVPVGIEEIKALTLDEATKIYESIWAAVGLNRVQSEHVATILFDQVVNRGAIGAIKSLQKTLNTEFGESLLVDGVLGNKTDGAIMRADEKKLSRKLIQAAQLHYAELVSKDSSQAVFLKGWLSRTFALSDLTA